MNCISILKDELFGLKSKKFCNPEIRIGARGIVIDNSGKIAILNKRFKNEYKLPGGGVENGETPIETFKRETLEETGCLIEIIGELGTIEEHKSLENFKQISYVFVSKVIKNTQQLNLTEKEELEGAIITWLYPGEALKLITLCEDKLKPSQYENLYHSKFIVHRDKLILEYYLKGKKGKIL